MKRLPTSLSVKALASDAKLTALECVFNANSVAKYTQIWASCNAPWGSSVIQGPGGLPSAALCGPAPPHQKKVEAEASGPLSSPCPPLISEVLEWRSSFGSGGMCVYVCGGLGLPSCQANTIWAAHWCYWGPGAVPRIHMIMKPRAIQSAGLKLGLRAFDSPQQPAGLPTPGPASFPARHKPPV